MYVRIKAKPQGFRKSIQIVKSVRFGKTTRQRIIKHIGVAYNEEELKQLKMLAESIKKDIENEGLQCLFSPEEMNEIVNESDKAKQKGNAAKKENIIDEKYQVDIRNTREEQRIINGIQDVYGKLYEESGYNKIIKNPARNKLATQILKHIVLARIANPASKKESVTNLEEKFGISLDLDKVYRMMDKLDDKAIERLQDISYQNTAQLFDNKIDVVFFDCTTIYFESFTEDELKQNGFSKDLKFNQPQILLSLMITQEGLPVGYGLFEGKAYEGHTLIPLVEKLKATYNIDKVVFVADSGMFNKMNIVELEARNYEYILGSRIKNLPESLKENILDQQRYVEIETGFKVARFEYKSTVGREDFSFIILENKPYKSTDIFSELHKRGYINGKGEILNKFNESGNSLQLDDKFFDIKKEVVKILTELNKTKTLVVSYSAKRAQKDAHDRCKSIEKVIKKLENNKNPKEYLSNCVYKKYIKFSEGSSATLDEKKIIEAAKWDGLHGTITNSKKFSDQEILNHYNNLWQVENAFRLTKHDIKVRPVFHWKPRRIKAHIAICYTAYSLIKYLEYRVKLQYKKMSPEAIRKTLVDVQSSIIYDIEKNIRYCLPSNVSPEAKKIYKLFNLDLSPIPFLLKSK